MRARTAVSKAKRNAGQKLILDIYGAYVRRLGGWIAVSDLVALIGQLGTDAQAVRSAISRMTRRGLLVPASRGSTRGYRLSQTAEQILLEGDRRIFSAIDAAELDDGWVLVSFSMPEHERHKRHLLRSRLTWLGFGTVSNGLWIAPKRSLAEVGETIRRLGFESYVDIFTAQYRGFAEVIALVRRAWDLDRLRTLYKQFIREHRWFLEEKHHGREQDSKSCFIDYTLTLHTWRRLPYLDPGLPVELLPVGWEGRVAADLVAAIRQRLEAPASSYVEQVMNGSVRRRAPASLPHPERTPQNRVADAGSSSRSRLRAVSARTIFDASNSSS